MTDALLEQDRTLRQRVTGWLNESWHFLIFLWERFNRDGVPRMASALSYTSLLALVPLLAIGLAMFAAFPVFRGLRNRFQEEIFQNFVPHVGAAVQEQVAHFVDKAGELTAAGIVGLSVTAIMLLVTIETSLNMIFRVEQARSVMSRLLVYWTSLTLGPLLIGASFSLTGYFAAVGRWAEGIAPPSLAAGLLPNLLIMIAFGLLYFAVPNRRVHPLDAAIGGIVAGLVFAALRSGFGFYVASARTYQTVYGAIATIPIFLVWMYLSWAVILLGAEIAAALPEWRAGRWLREGALPPRNRLALALEILDVLFRAALDGSKGATREALLDRTAAPEEPLRATLRRLRDTGFIARTVNGRYVLSRDLEAATLYDLVERLDLGLGRGSLEGPPADWQRRVQSLIDAVDRADREVLGLSLRDLLNGTATHQQPPGAAVSHTEADGRG